MYDIRAKQQFIYRSTHLKEIIGGSCIIRDAFDDDLYPAALEVRDRNGNASDQEAIYNYQHDGKTEMKFSFAAFEERMRGGQYIGEVIYNGGGNYFILYKDAQTCRDVTAVFTRKILERIGTLKVICTYITDVHPEDYKGDQQRLYDKHRYTEGQEAPTAPWGTLPIVQTDYLTSMPLTNYYRTVGSGAPVAVTRESYAKYVKYDQVKGTGEGKDLISDEKILDNLVTRKGEESLLAVIYIDGNNMGAKVAEHNAGRSSYDDCIESLRVFSSDIQENFIDGRKPGINAVAEQYSDKGHTLRLVIGSGDEITIITNARAALEVARSYLKALSSSDGWSACAGISIFHSHTPFADAYRIAEECCETGKQYMKRKAVDDPENWQNACMLDFHFNQGVIGVDLEDIRDSEETTDLSIPWIVSGVSAGPDDITYDHADGATTDDVTQMQEILNIFGRGNTKGLLQASREGNGELYMEIRRIRAHMTPEKASRLDAMASFLYDGTTVREKVRGLMIRMIPVYDIWFSKGDAQ